MKRFYQRVPAASIRHEIDGKEYVNSDAAMYSTETHKLHVRIMDTPRLLRVAFVRNGEAYVYLGCAGDKIALITNLPFSVSVDSE